MKIGVFGGTFNPVHYGHLRAAEEAREKAGLDRVLFVPSGSPPLKSGNIADAVQRYEMTRLATAGNPNVEVLDIESSRTGKSYTVDTLNELGKLHKGADLYFLLGVDAFLDLPNWWMPDALVEMVSFIIVSRPGIDFSALEASPYFVSDDPALKRLSFGQTGSETLSLRSGKTAVLMNITRFAISSTEIRSRVSRGLSIKYLLPEAVESFIISNGLYRNT